MPTPAELQHHRSSIDNYISHILEKACLKNLELGYWSADSYWHYFQSQASGAVACLFKLSGIESYGREETRWHVDPDLQLQNDNTGR